uniref:Uncharacterized AAA domain-containing protein ycf46 n=1 Tax=Haptophyceae sp. NIES-3900 TaxID=2748608 RepID=A0A7R6WF83_9EUKA|nr:conserved protein [Haptophyceae sp. NIES-3900]
MSFTNEFESLLRARYPLIYIPTYEEERAEYLIKACARKLGISVVYSWDFISGYVGNPNDSGFAIRNPLQALELIEKLTERTPAIFILKDFDSFLNDVSILRKLKNLSRLLKRQPKNLVIIAPEVNIPSTLTEIFTLVELDLPTAEEINKELTRLLKSLDKPLSEELLESLTRSCQGLSLERIRRVLSKIVMNYGEVNVESLGLILSEKKQVISQTKILDFYPTQTKIRDVGGLENLKLWLRRRSGGFSQKASNYGLPAPRGVLLLGIQGTGKSLTAKAIANEWNLPLLRLDIGRLFGGIVGESESRVRQMIQSSEALAPCVLWIDEIDKAFSGIKSSGDSGTTSRVLGTLITWLSEKTSPVFIVATANAIDSLPLELIRKGRLDEIFFIGLPKQKEREQIFQVHLSKVRPQTWSKFDIMTLGKLSDKFSGAEIEQVIIESMHLAFSEDREFTDYDIIQSIKQFVPLANTEKEQIETLEEWAQLGRVRLASN